MSQHRIARILVSVAAASLLSIHLLMALGASTAAKNEQPPAPPVCLSILVPLYVHPSRGGSGWNAVIEHPLQSKAIERIIILNPNSGPGATINVDFQNAVKAAQHAGNKVYGYVSTRYGKVNLARADEEVRKYIKWYGVDGIFVDEVSAKAAQVARYYQPLTTFITSTINGGGVILNNGTYPDASYAGIRVPKPSKLQIVVFEHDYAAFTAKSFAVPKWITKYPPAMFINIIYNTPTDRLGDVLQLSALRGVGAVYATDESLPNPYAALPSYWTELNQRTQAGCSR